MKNKQQLLYWILSIIIIFSIAGFLYWKWVLVPGQKPVDLPPLPPPVTEYEIPVDSFYIEEGVVQPNSFLSDLLYKLGAAPDDVARVGAVDRDLFDVRTIRAGNRYKAFYSSSDSTRRLCYWAYEKSPIDYCVFCFQDSFHVYQGQKPFEIRVRRSEAEITSSLWNAAVEKEISPMLALNLSDIYAWTIDFFGLQKGDKFTVVYDEIYVDSSFVEIGHIHSAEFFHGGKKHYAFYFEQDSVGSYWDEAGNSLKRAFLKAPLKFSRISSHFSYARKHPVLRIVRPHTGVDYAAPAGTPVMSIGDGTIIEKGYKGGGGHTIKIRHNSVYITAYLHLSKYASDIRSGGKVAQGQIIGYVGSSGLSTGPHLDFRVWMNGKPINPLSIESPPVEPIHEHNRTQYDSIKNISMKQLSVSR